MTAFEARTRLGELIDRVRYTREPCVILRHGRPAAVILDYAGYKTLERQQESSALSVQYAQWQHDLVSVIVKKYRPEKILVFGSVARGDIRSGSDIDLCIIKRTRKRRLDRIDEVVALLPAEIPVDLVILTPQEWGERIRRRDTMVKEIMDTGHTLYEAQ